MEVNRTIRHLGIYQRNESTRGPGWSNLSAVPIPGFQMEPLLNIQARVAPDAEYVTYAVETDIASLKADDFSYPNELSELRHSIDSTDTHGVTYILVFAERRLVARFQDKLPGWTLKGIDEIDDVVNLKIDEHVGRQVVEWLNGHNDGDALMELCCMTCAGPNDE